MAIDHPHVKRETVEIHTQSDGTIKRVLVIETDLILNGLDPHHQKDEVDALLERAGTFFQAHSDHYDSLLVRQD